MLLFLFHFRTISARFDGKMMREGKSIPIICGWNAKNKLSLVCNEQQQKPQKLAKALQIEEFNASHPLRLIRSMG